MIPESKNRERTKINELARKYEAKGYSVTIEPTLGELPAFLKDLNYHPDIIARSERGNILIEVKTKESIRNSKYLVAVSERIKKTKDWEFLLVYTNSKRKQRDIRRVKQTRKSIDAVLLELRAWIESDQDLTHRAALVLLWSALEAALTAVMPGTSTGTSKSPFDLVRDAVIAGVISKDSMEFLEVVIPIRNQIAHGDLTQKISRAQLTRLHSICREILQFVD